MFLRKVLAVVPLLGVPPGCDQSAVCPSSPELPATTAAGELYVGAFDPYSPGPLPTRRVDLAVCEQDAPVAMRIITPSAPGRYAVAQLQHGFLSEGVWYTEILEHVASHGFVAVAPQMYAPGSLPTSVPPVDEEISRALRVVDWVFARLSDVAGVEADTGRLGLIGHSRGGKVAWGVLSREPSRALAVAGLDPVDGSFFGQAAVIRGPFGFPFPSLVIGAGLGSVPTGGSPIACAPEGINHVQFYEASASPAWHIVAPGAGHADFYDPGCSNCGFITGVCRRGLDPDAARRLTAGLLTAFLRGALQGDTSAYRLLTDTAAAPIPIEIEVK
jgi:chlorophyllase